MKQVEIITIGDELLIGQVVDTNSAWMATRLNEWGFQVKQITSVHDDAEQICSALRDAERRADVILLTGGLGPTKDDITKHTLCEYFGTALTYHPEIREHLEQLYAARPEVLNRLTDTQCLFPENATLIWNRVGSAQVMCWSRPSSFDNRPLTIISMPGVPYEMMWAMEHGVGEVLRSLTADAGAIVHRTIQVYGIPESSLAIKIEEWEDALPGSMHLAYLPKNGIIRLRLSGYGVQPEEVEKEIQKLLPLLGDLVFATEDLPVEVLAGNMLKQRSQTISTAESCTGGKLAELLNRHAGSSAFYRGSVVAYANDVKTGVLGVQPFDDPVTEQVVLQMAEGAKTLLHTDYAIATSGIAGSNGEEDSSKTNNYSESPVGTVWIALATPEGTQARRFQLGKLREQITDRAAQVALIWLIRELGRN